MERPHLCRSFSRRHLHRSPVGLDGRPLWPEGHAHPRLNRFCGHHFHHGLRPNRPPALSSADHPGRGLRFYRRHFGDRGHNHPSKIYGLRHGDSAYFPYHRGDCGAIHRRGFGRSYRLSKYIFYHGGFWGAATFLVILLVQEDQPSRKNPKPPGSSPISASSSLPPPSLPSLSPE